MTKFGIEILQFAELDSSNNYAAKLIDAGRCQSGSVIMADFQSAGRGQQGNVWQSDSQKNLLMTLAWQPVNLSVHEQIKLSWFFALMWVKCLQRFGLDAQIKWPNDIYVGSRKIAGILIENQLSGTHLYWSIVGMGVNVQQFPENLAATSILEETGVSVRPFTVMTEFIALANGHQSWIYEPIDTLKARFEAALYGKGKQLQFEANNELFTAILIGVDAQGKLLLNQESGLKAYDLKELRFVLT
ncbi:MAG: hypothetical protein RLZZ301_981 [Bacteroidota bacterium]